MKVFFIGFSLPRKGKFITLRKHKTEDRLHWTADDRRTYFDFRERVEQLYERGPAGLALPRPLIEAVFDSNLTPTQAVNRVLPYYLSSYKSSVSRTYLPGQSTGEFDILNQAGTAEEPNGIRHVVIAKGHNSLILKPGVLEAAAALRDRPFTEDELKTLAGRSDPALVRAVAEAEGEAAEIGSAKIVAIPAEAEVALSKNPGGEIVREIARVWS